LGHVSPIQAMKQWQRSHPELFNRRVTNQPGHDSYTSFRLFDTHCKSAQVRLSRVMKFLSVVNIDCLASIGLV